MIRAQGDIRLNREYNPASLYGIILFQYTAPRHRTKDNAADARNQSAFLKGEIMPGDIRTATLKNVILLISSIVISLAITLCYTEKAFAERTLF